MQRFEFPSICWLTIKKINYLRSTKIIKLTYFTIFALIALSSKAQNDSVIVRELQEVQVHADREVETITQTILIPTQTDKAHSAGAFDLMHHMNISGLDVLRQEQQILNNVGQAVVLCINGIEATADEVEVLRAKNIISIEYQRSPTGKYAGTGGVLNFKTIQYKYGGNVYLSAKESFIYNSGDYLASADYSKGNSRFQIIYSNDWGRSRDKQTIDNTYLFDGGGTLRRTSEVNPHKSKTIDNVLNLRYTAMGTSYRLSAVGGFADTYTPYNDITQNTIYNGIYQGSATAINKSHSYGNVFSLKANYTLWMPQDQIIDLTVSSSLGKNSYRYSYQESSQQDINTGTKEDNGSIAAILQYYKTFKNGFSFSSVLNHNYTRYSDTYDGSISESQKLKTNVSSILFQLAGQMGKTYTYFSAGASNTSVCLNDENYNYLNPTGYYGVTYSPRNNISLALNGYYVHTLFDPSNKNNLSLPTSFFETTQGNPDLKPLKVLGNTLELNYHWSKTSLTASYMSYIYFDNILHYYSADADHIYTHVTNDGNFYGNMLSINLTHRMFSDKLKISLQGIEEYNSIRGDIYKMHKNIVRGKLKVDYTIKKASIGAELATPYTSLDCRAPYYTKKGWNNSFYTVWNIGNWRFEATINNPFCKYMVERNYMDYPCLDMNVKNYNSKQGRNISVKAVWNFDYGKKVESEDHNAERIMNSAIMKSY